jgi:hypothetical protein
MDIQLLLPIARAAVRFCLDHATVGAIESLSGDAAKNILNKLSNLLSNRFSNRPELNQAGSESKAQIIANEALIDADFRKQLEELVAALQQIETRIPNINQRPNTSSINQETNNMGTMGDVVGGDKVGGDKFTGDKFH